RRDDDADRGDVEAGAAPADRADERTEWRLAEDAAGDADELADAGKQGEAPRREEVRGDDQEADPAEGRAEPHAEPADRGAGEAAARCEDDAAERRQHGG